MTLQEVAGFLGGQLFGPKDLVITGPAKIESAGPEQITFLSNPKYRHYLGTTKAGAVVIDKPGDDVAIPYILVPDAYVGFLMLLKLFSPPAQDYIGGVSDKAVIHATAKLHPSVKIAPLVYIGPDVEIGENTMIYPGVVLLKDVRVGADCILYPNVSVREGCIIGNRAILNNGCVIGSEGFGFAPKGEIYIKIPQIGNVIIEDDVEIGANTTIDRATLGSTIIRQGCKLDNLVQIAHNVVLGKNSVMAGQSGIAGSTEVGEHATFGGQVAIIGHIKVGKNVSVGGQSGVSKDTEDNAVLFGSPAMPLPKMMRIEASMRHLPDLIKRFKALEEEVQKLKSEIKQN
jgi:UDP-3-O-[3-hydroxymyristoyl] glucosamine N-acyltransferase